MTQILTRTKEEQYLLETLRSRPDLMPVVEEILSLAATSSVDEMSLDEAEDKTWEVIKKTGHEMLQGWCQRKADREVEKALDADFGRPHEKKRS